MADLNLTANSIIVHHIDGQVYDVEMGDSNPVHFSGIFTVPPYSLYKKRRGFFAALARRLERRLHRKWLFEHGWDCSPYVGPYDTRLPVAATLKPLGKVYAIENDGTVTVEIG